MQEGRQLLAVMFTDIVGYTSLTAADEKHSLNLVETVNHKLKSCIESYHGEWVQQVGDGTLSTFVSAHDALTCAVAIQQEFLAKPIVELRIGIHIGDIVVKLPNVWGSGVNVASRIESFAQKGEIVVSQLVKDALSCHPEFAFDARGAHSFKGVPEPIAVFAIDAATTQITRPYDFPAESQKSASTPNSSAQVSTKVTSAQSSAKNSAQGFAKYKTYALLSVVLVALIAAVVSTSLFDSARQTISFKTAGINFDSASNTPEKQFIKSLSRHLSKATSAQIERTGGSAAPRISITPDDGTVTISHANEKLVYDDVNTAFANLDQVATLIINAQDWLTDSEKHNLALYLDAYRDINRVSNVNDVENLIAKVEYLLATEPENMNLKALNCRLAILRGVVKSASPAEIRDSSSTFCSVLNKEATTKQSIFRDNAYLALIEYYSNIGEYSFAENFLTLIPENTYDAIIAKTDFYFEQNKLDKVKDTLLRGKETLLLSSADIEVRLGLYQLMSGNLRLAEQDFKNILSSTPDLFVAQKHMATTLFLLGKLEDANYFYNDINSKGATPQTLNNQGTALYFLGRYRDAARVFKLAMQAMPNNYLYIGNYADSLQALPEGQLESTTLYNKAIDVAMKQLLSGNDNTFITLDLAHYFSQLGDFAQADEYFKLFLKSNKTNSEYHYYQAISFAKRNNNTKAIQHISLAESTGTPKQFLANTPALKPLMTLTEKGQLQ